MSRMTTTLRPRHEWKRIARTRLCALGFVMPAVLVGGEATAQDCTISADDWSNIQLFRRCLAEVGLDWWETPDGETILHTAAGRTNNPTIVILLLEAGADPNARDDWGSTPLHRGVHNANLVVTSHLLAAGADPNIRNNRGNTPLKSAPLVNRALVSMLLEAGADPNIRGNYGYSTLHNAVRFGNPAPVVSMLLDAGADPGAITYDEDAWTPLHLAAVGDDPALVATLLNAGANPLATSADGQTPLHSAAYHGSRSVVSALLAGGAGAGFTTLHAAALTGDRAALATALEEDGDPDAADSYGWTPLHFAALAGRWTDEPMMIENLVAAGADPEARNLNGMTPMGVLSKYGSKASVAAALLRARAGTGPDAGLAAGRERGAISAEPAADVALLEAGDMFRDCALCPEMVVVPSGSFMMGSPEGDGWEQERPQHRVTISTRIAVGVYEVTFGEWDACALAGGCADYWPGDEGWGRGHRPVINVSWDDAQGYLQWLSRETGERYRLLSEAEWEYVARAGTQTARYWGESESGQCRYANGLDRTAEAGGEAGFVASCADGYEATAPRGSFQPNGFGLYDILGNVSEWTEDCENRGGLNEEGYRGAPADGTAWHTGDCSGRRYRGGSWGGYQFTLRSAIRSSDAAGDRSAYRGFRVARTMN